MTFVKHPPLKGVALPMFRDALLAATRYGEFELGAFQAALSLTPIETDAILREAASLGYVTFSDPGTTDHPHWGIARAGRVLMADKQKKRITRDVVDRHLDRLITRARNLNAESRHLHHIASITLFGSALYKDRPDYGDIDVEVDIVRQPIPSKHKDYLVDLLFNEASSSRKSRTIGGRSAVAFELDYDNIVRRLKQGLTTLSMSTRKQIEELGCEHKCIYRFDSETLTELPADKSITPRTQPDAPDQIAEEISDLPETTCINPIADMSPKKISVNAFPRSDDMHELLADAWSGTWKNGRIRAKSICGNDDAILAHGTLQLPLWSHKDLSGLEILKRAVDWAKSRNLYIPSKDNEIRIHSDRGTTYMIFGRLRFTRRRGETSSNASYVFPDITPDYFCLSQNILHGLNNLMKEVGAGSKGVRTVQLDLDRALNSNLLRLPDLSQRAKDLHKLMTNRLGPSTSPRHKGLRWANITWHQKDQVSECSWIGAPTKESITSFSDALDGIAISLEEDIRNIEVIRSVCLSFQLDG